MRNAIAFLIRNLYKLVCALLRWAHTFDGIIIIIARGAHTFFFLHFFRRLSVSFNSIFYLDSSQVFCFRRSVVRDVPF